MRVYRRKCRSSAVEIAGFSSSGTSFHGKSLKKAFLACFTQCSTPWCPSASGTSSSTCTSCCSPKPPRTSSSKSGGGLRPPGKLLGFPELPLNLGKSFQLSPNTEGLVVLTGFFSSPKLCPLQYQTPGVCRGFVASGKSRLACACT